MRQPWLGPIFFTVACVTACAEPRKSAVADSVLSRPIAHATPPAAVHSSDEPVGEAARRPWGADSVRIAGRLIIRNFCEGEGCSFPWSFVACTTLTLRSSDADNAAQVGQVNVGDTVLAETGNVHIASPGLAILRRDAAIVEERPPPDGPFSSDTVRMAAGDSVLIWTYHGEGDWAIEHKGRRIVVEEFWSEPARNGTLRDDDAVAAVSLSKPDTRLWLRIRHRNSAVGWWERVWPRDQNSIVFVDPDWPERCPRTR